MKVFLELDGDKVISCNSSPVSSLCVQVEIEDNHPILRGVLGYKLIDGLPVFEEDQKQNELLEGAKERKISELDKDCNESILEGFAHNINGERYLFSYDIESQINLERVRVMFDKGVLHEREWTAKDSNGNYVRIIIDKQIMQELSIISQKHVDKKIAKYRGYYIPRVIDAKTIKEVAEIQWVSDEEIISNEELQTELERMNNTPTVEQLQLENQNLTTALLELTDMLFGE